MTKRQSPLKDRLDTEVLSFDYGATPPRELALAWALSADRMVKRYASERGWLSITAENLPDLFRNVELAPCSPTVGRLLVELRRAARWGVPESFAEALRLPKRKSHSLEARGRRLPWNTGVGEQRRLLGRVASAVKDAPAFGRPCAKRTRDEAQREAKSRLAEIVRDYEVKYRSRKEAYARAARQLGLTSGEAVRSLLKAQRPKRAVEVTGG